MEPLSRGDRIRAWLRWRWSQVTGRSHVETCQLCGKKISDDVAIYGAVPASSSAKGKDVFLVSCCQEHHADLYRRALRW